jgi:hypothetical protein
MNSLMLLFSLLLSPACMTGADARQAPTPNQSARAVAPAPRGLAQPREGVSIKASAGEEVRLLAVLEEFARVTGQNLLLNPEARTMLGNMSTGLSRSVEVPPAEVYSFVEALLVSNDFLLLQLSDEEPRLLSVHSLRGKGSESLRMKALSVPAAEVAQYAGHPALLIQTMLTLPTLDVRHVTNSMRSLLVDSNSQLLIPIGDTNSMILVGRGSEIAALTAMLQQADEQHKLTLAAREKRELEERKARAAEKQAAEKTAREGEQPVK